MRNAACRGCRAPAAIAAAVLALSPPAAAGPVAVGYGTDPAIAVTDDRGGIMVGFNPTVGTLPDGSDAPALRPVSVDGVLGSALPIPVASEPFTGPLAGPIWLGSAGTGAGPFWMATARADASDSGDYAVVIARYDGAAGTGMQPVWQWLPIDQATPWLPRVAAQHGPAGEVLFVTYDTYRGEPILENYLASYVQRVSNGLGGQPIPVSEEPGTAAFRGAGLLPLAGREAGQAFLMGVGIEIPAPFRMSLHFHELVAATGALDSQKQLIAGQHQPGQLRAGSRSAELNGHLVGEKADMAIDLRTGRLYVAYAVNPNPTEPGRDQGDVRIARSDDRAASWLAGGQRGDFKPPALAADKTQFFPAIDVDGDGCIHLVYLQNETGAVAGGVLHASTAHVYYTASKDGGATWTPAAKVSDDTTGLRFGDPPRPGDPFSIGGRQAVRAAPGAAGRVVHLCWPSYDHLRPDGERALVVCSAITNPFCGDGTVDPGEVCDDGNTADGDCCSSSCRAETGTPCNLPGACTTNDVCGADGTCAAGDPIPAETILAAVRSDLGGEPGCEGIAIPRGVERRWRKARALLERVGGWPSSGCERQLSTRAYGMLWKARWIACGSPNTVCPGERLPPACRDALAPVMDEAKRRAVCWHFPRQKDRRCGGGLSRASGGP